MTDIVDELKWRGLIALSTDEDALRKAFADGPVTFYCGFDPTAPSLHMGNLVQLITMRRIQDAGHFPLPLVGGATGLIGDPRPTSERTLNDPETVAPGSSASAARSSATSTSRARSRPGSSTTSTGPPRSRRSTCCATSASTSGSARCSPRTRSPARLNSDAGISYTEFSYQVLQGMDYLELYRRYGCTLQTGGSDQWGNLTAGVDLIRKAEGRVVHALGTPLVTKADGTKFGKTETGTLWLDPELTIAVRLLPVLAQRRRPRRGQVPAHLHLPQSGGDRRAGAPHHRAAGRLRCPARPGRGRHRPGPRRGAVRPRRAPRRRRCSVRATWPTSTPRRWPPASPSSRTSRSTNSGCWCDLFAATGLVASKSAARRAIQEGGAYVNNVKIGDVEAGPAEADLLHGRWLLLRRGKRSLAAVQLNRG